MIDEKQNRIHKRYVNGKWKLYSEEDVRFLSLSLCGEAGELANFIKKRWRGDLVDWKDVAKELADIQVFLNLIAHAEGINLSQEVELKLDEVEKRLEARDAQRRV